MLVKLLYFSVTNSLEALPEDFKSYDIFSLVDSTVEKVIGDTKSRTTTLQTITSNLATKVKELCIQNNTLQE